jgi:hypothetical protein
MASVALFDPVPPPPMTREQSLRGRDAEMTCVLLASAYDPAALARACERHLDPAALASHGVATLDRGIFELAFTATAAEVSRTPGNRLLEANERALDGPR